jgi:hypothetical protein
MNKIIFNISWDDHAFHVTSLKLFYYHGDNYNLLGLKIPSRKLPHWCGHISNMWIDNQILVVDYLYSWN